MSCPPATTPMRGKTCVVTGANSGIGKATAHALAVLGAHVILVCRDRARGEAAALDVSRAADAAGNGGIAELRLADLSSQADVRALAAGILRDHSAVHVLVNNAGLAQRRRELSVDGIEYVFAVNYLAYFLLTELLLPALRGAGSARIVNVASDAHRAVSAAQFDDLQGERRYRTFRQYATTKLADILFTYALARRLEGTGVTVNALHPGVVATGIWRDIPVLRSIGRLFMLSPEAGAQTPVYLATSSAVEGVTGQYFEKCHPVRTSALSYDHALQERLWVESERLTGSETTVQA